jgi:hypothetical protein
MPGGGRSPSRGFAHQPGWHRRLRPETPHLSEKAPVSTEVEIENPKFYNRPGSHGDTWVLAQRWRVVRPLTRRKPFRQKEQLHAAAEVSERMSVLNSLSGKQIIMTASIPGGTREQWGEAIRGAAGFLQDTFTRHTTYSVIAEEPGKGKISAAQRYRIATLEMSDFRGLVATPWSKEDIAHANQDFVNTLAEKIKELLGT